jgi:hypothetical protein
MAGGSQAPRRKGVDAGFKSLYIKIKVVSEGWISNETFKKCAAWLEAVDWNAVCGRLSITAGAIVLAIIVGQTVYAIAKAGDFPTTALCFSVLSYTGIDVLRKAAHRLLPNHKAEISGKQASAPPDKKEPV